VESVDNGVPSAGEQYETGDRGSKQQDCEQLEQAAEQRQQQQPADPNQRELVTEERDRVERHPSRRFASSRELLPGPIEAGRRTVILGRPVAARPSPLRPPQAAHRHIACGAMPVR
jgi:hypothetical protein